MTSYICCTITQQFSVTLLLVVYYVNIIFYLLFASCLCIMYILL